MVERIELKKTWKGYTEEIEPAGEAMVAIFKDMLEWHEAGKPLYIEFLDGDRKGSIGLLEPSPKYRSPWIHAETRQTGKFYSTDKQTWNYDCRIYGQLKFTGKSHRPDATIYPDGEVVWLKGYEGPTVWKKFDAKAAKAELLADHGQKDRFGDLLSVGDKVVYVDLAYGSGASIELGTIQEFTASVDSKRHTIYTIVRNDEKGHTMKTEKPEQLTMKLENMQR